VGVALVSLRSQQDGILVAKLCRISASRAGAMPSFATSKKRASGVYIM
jgi:hypothetical protein